MIERFPETGLGHRVETRWWKPLMFRFKIGVLDLHLVAQSRYVKYEVYKRAFSFDRAFCCLSTQCRHTQTRIHTEDPILQRLQGTLSAPEQGGEQDTGFFVGHSYLCWGVRGRIGSEIRVFCRERASERFRSAVL